MSPRVSRSAATFALGNQPSSAPVPHLSPACRSDRVPLSEQERSLSVMFHRTQPSSESRPARSAARDRTHLPLASVTCPVTRQERVVGGDRQQLDRSARAARGGLRGRAGFRRSASLGRSPRRPVPQRSTWRSTRSVSARAMSCLLRRSRSSVASARFATSARSPGSSTRPDRRGISIRSCSNRRLRAARAEGRTVGAVIAVDLFGQCADYGQIEEICERYRRAADRGRR